MDLPRSTFYDAPVAAPDDPVIPASLMCRSRNVMEIAVGILAEILHRGRAEQLVV